MDRCHILLHFATFMHVALYFILYFIFFWNPAVRLQHTINQYDQRIDGSMDQRINGSMDQRIDGWGELRPCNFNMQYGVKISRSHDLII